MFAKGSPSGSTTGSCVVGKLPTKTRENADLWQALDKETARHQVEWRWVKGHAGHRENEMCDELAAKRRNPTEDDIGYQPEPQ